MRRPWLILALLAIAGCSGFDEFYYHDGFLDEAMSEPVCGCAPAPRTLPPPHHRAAIQNTSGGTSLPQSREPELLR